jgi:Zn finger protein HypA/HybF involved in hydrogenase expression
LSSDILTCRCRHCGQNFPYLRSDAGHEKECPECHNNVHLPGSLASIATKQRRRINSTPTLILEIGGCLLTFWFPIGTVIGIIMVVIGWRKSNALRCSSCEAPAAAAATRCPNCRAAFSSD